MIQREFINDFCDFLYRRNPSGGFLMHSNRSQVVRIGSHLKILYVGTFGIQWFKKSLLMIIVTSYSNPAVFWKNAFMVRELPGPKLGFWGPLGSGTLPEIIGIYSTFFGGSSSILDRSACTFYSYDQYQGECWLFTSCANPIVDNRCPYCTSSQVGCVTSGSEGIEWKIINLLNFNDFELQ